ncbi:MAG: cupin domain-containing protein [Candidatus Aenigmarchaeota archaeon]|nr:cupin domain-containing protein [Candidatus Aenigmarchaeota archaeon]
MKKYKFTLKEAYDFGWEGIKGKAYNNSSDFKDASVALFEVTGRHGKVKSLVSNRVYYVLEGEGEFIIDEKTIPVKPTDVIIIPKNTPYDYKAIKGTVLKLLLVHTPSWAPEKEVKLE